jgi:Tol biopolymer transport system component
MVARRPLAILASVCVALQLTAWVAVLSHPGDHSRSGQLSALGASASGGTVGGGTAGGDGSVSGDPSSSGSGSGSSSGFGGSPASGGQSTGTTAKSSKSSHSKSTTTTAPQTPPTTASGFTSGRPTVSVPSVGASTVTSAGLWVVRADGTGLHRLADSARRRAAWSPDGTKLASDNGGQLYVVDADGTGLRPINVGGIAVGSEAWSPDGRQIALVSQPDPFQHVTLVNADGSGAPIDVGKLATAPAWAPDGRLAFCQATDASFLQESLVVRAPSGALTTLAGNVLCNAPPAWSPDGTKIAFDSPLGLSVANADGSGVRLIGPAHLSYHLGWSPDGSRVAYTASVAVLAASTNASPATSLAIDAVDPSWAPSGWVAMSHSDGSPGSRPTDVELVDGDGANRHAIALAGPGSLTSPQWSPDGTWLAFTATGY